MDTKEQSQHVLPSILLWAALTALLLPLGAMAGSLDSPGAPTAAGAQMYTLEDLYNRLISGAAGTMPSGFTEPSTGPTVGTMHTLNDIMGKAPSVDDTNGASPADVASGKTFWGLTSGGWGLQTGTAATKFTYPAPVARTWANHGDGNANDDGDWQVGVRRTGARFVDNGDGTVTDKLTGLIWLRNADCPGAPTDWSTALSDVAQLNSNGTMNGNDCGDTSNSGSHQIDWRLPNANELRSLLYFGKSTSPTLRDGNPFINVKGASTDNPYWSSTTDAGTPSLAWNLSFVNGGILAGDKLSSQNHVWAVRAGSTNAPAPVAQTGQSLCYDPAGTGTTAACAGTGQDGELQAGVAWPSQRFTVNGDGTVTDNLTGLIWLQNAGCFGSAPLINQALTDASGLKDGQCGLTDGSAAGDWRLPNENELWSLIDLGQSGPALPTGHPFSNLALNNYWSSTYLAPNYLGVVMSTGSGTHNSAFVSTTYVWAVRGGE